MLCTYLYNAPANVLKVLNDDELLLHMPGDREVPARQNGAAHRGQGKCRDGELMWVDVTAPDHADFALLEQRFGLHAMVSEDIRAHEGRPKLHNYEDYLYLIFHAVRRLEPAETPTPEADQSTSDSNSGCAFGMDVCEIDCLVGPDWVVTIHHEPLPPLEDLHRRWQRRPDLMKAGTGYLLYEIMDEVLDDYFPLLDALDERIDSFEERLFDHQKNDNSANQGTLSGDIFALKRCLIQVRRVAGPTRDVVNTLLRLEADNGGRNFAYYQDLYDHSTRIVENIDSFRDMLSSALDAYLATESNRMNGVMKTLTACSIILLVPNLIAAIYGMNFDDMPKQHGFWGSIAAMASIIVGLALAFKHKRWL
jgi:magnesium transporter